MRKVAFTSALAVVMVAAVGTPNALALAVIEPVDGATVGSRPVFTVDRPMQGGSLTAEFSKSPDLLTAGSRAGWFVEPVDQPITFFDVPPYTTVQQHNPMLTSGVGFSKPTVKAGPTSGPQSGRSPSATSR